MTKNCPKPDCPIAELNGGCPLEDESIDKCDKKEAIKKHFKENEDRCPNLKQILEKT